MFYDTAHPLKIGISSCLLGQPVRYDGGHKRSDFCSKTLSQHAQYISFCPEMAAGMPAPRPSIRLLKRSGQIIATTRDDDDVSEAIIAAGEKQLTQLDQLSAYIFCAKSPSCGMSHVPLFDEATSNSSKSGIGLFAQQVMEKYPLLPIEENGRLNDMPLRENFITRVYAYKRWQILQAEGLTPRALLEFHSRYKYQLMANHPVSYKQLGALLANLSDDFDNKCQQYITLFMTALKKQASRKNHCNVLQHLQGYFKKKLSQRQRGELATLIDDYRLGLTPLMAPMTMIRHYLAEHPDSYIEKQHYLQPYPAAFKLRYGL
mgnify:CR=1 FL=1